MSKKLLSPGNLFLRNSKELERVKKVGKRVHTPLFNLVFCHALQQETRIGVVVGRRLGKAVLRNRAKRIFREIIRNSQGELVKGRDIIVFPKFLVFLTKHLAILETWETALRQAGLHRVTLQPQCPESSSG